MVVVSPASVNTMDIPEATFSAQGSLRKKKHAICKWILDSAEERNVTHGCKSEIEAMFPSVESNLVKTIVAESTTLEKALDVLLALVDDEIAPVRRQDPITKDPVTDRIGFPSLLDADGWEVVPESDSAGRVRFQWCDVVSHATQSIPQTDKRHLSMVLEVLPSNSVMAVAADGHDGAELESEHECRQRQGVERRLRRAKHNRRPTKTLSMPSEVKKVAGKHERKDSEPPAWRLCRFEDRL